MSTHPATDERADRAPSSTSTPYAARGCWPRRAPSRRRTTAPAGSSCPSPSSDTDRRRTASARSGCRPGVTVFDSASWNGIAIDSTCGGHGTCHKCKVRVEAGEPDHPARRPHLQPRAARRRLAAGLPGQRDSRPRRRRTPAHHPAQGRHRRRRPAGDPAAGDPEAVRRAHRADPRGPADRPRPAARRDRRPRAARRPARAAPAAGGAARGGLQGHRGRRGRGAHRRRARRHHRRAATRSPSTSAPPRSWRPCSTSPRARRWRWPRCSTGSSRSAATSSPGSARR